MKRSGKRKRPNCALRIPHHMGHWPLVPALAYLLTFSAYGMHLPGSEKGWVDAQHRMSNPRRKVYWSGHLRSQTNHLGGTSVCLHISPVVRPRGPRPNDSRARRDRWRYSSRAYAFRFQGLCHSSTSPCFSRYAAPPVLGPSREYALSPKPVVGRLRFPLSFSVNYRLTCAPRSPTHQNVLQATRNGCARRITSDGLPLFTTTKI